MVVDIYFGGILLHDNDATNIYAVMGNLHEHFVE